MTHVLKGISLSLRDACPVCVRADAGQLRRVFYNLLDNAIKYTAPGGTVTVTSQASADGIMMEVCDTGIGIASEHLSRIFDRFFRVDAARTGENGAGLGLSLCQSIVKGLGGTITARSEPGQGTSFVVLIPITKGD